MILIVHIQQFDVNAPVRFYVGRACKDFRSSPLANPFVIGKDGSREEVIAKYKSWLWENRNLPKINSAIEQIRILEKLHGDIELGCWCHPKPCHAEIIRSYIEWLNKE